MAKHTSEKSKSNFAEKGLRFLRNVHIALGGLALTGALLFPPLATVAAYEGVNAAAHESLRRAVKPHRK